MFVVCFYLTFSSKLINVILFLRRAEHTQLVFVARLHRNLAMIFF